MKEMANHRPSMYSTVHMQYSSSVQFASVRQKTTLRSKITEPIETIVS